MCIKRKLTFEDYKNLLEANELEKEINNLEKNQFDVDNLTENQKEFMRTIDYYGNITKRKENVTFFGHAASPLKPIF